MTLVTNVTPSLRRKRTVPTVPSAVLDPPIQCPPETFRDFERPIVPYVCTDPYPSRSMVSQGVEALKEAWRLC